MPLSHVRPRFWDSERYTESQALEFRQLRALYTTHLVPVFGAALPDIFQPRNEGNDYYPRYTASTLAFPALTEVPPSETPLPGPFFAIASTLVKTLDFYEEGRRQRWSGSGHPNDPTRLLGIFIRNTAMRFLAYAPSTEVTLRQVRALRQYLEALARTRVFTGETDSHGSIVRLLHNLATPLQLLEKRLQHHIRLYSAREHFEEMKNTLSHTLSEAAYYLFCVPAAEDRTQLPFSLVNMQARVVNPKLTKALNTREGLLLKQWMYAPGVVHTLFPQADAKEEGGLLMRQPIPLLTTQSVTALLDEKGQPHPAWRGFLENDTASLELDPGVAGLKSGICPLLLKTSTGSLENPLVSDLIQLHGLFETLATYQEHLHLCWELAGFGGDNCVYDQLAEAVTSILQELCAFNTVLSSRLERFQERLDLLYKTALEAISHVGWRANYQAAKASQEKLIAMLQSCNTALTRIMQHAQNKEARVLRRSLALKAYAKLQAAPDFLNRARECIGLAPKTHYPGLEDPEAKATRFTNNPFTLSLASDEVSIDQVLVALFPSATESSVWLSRLSAETPSTKPWGIFRGSGQRYRYLHNNTRLQEIGRDFMYLTLHAQMPMTPEKADFIKRLRKQLQQEQTRIEELSANLWWPFHRASIRFFATWQAGITDKLASLSTIMEITGAEGASTRTLHQALLPAARQGLISEPLSTEDREKLLSIYERYSQLSVEERANFDVWQRSQFGGLLWDGEGTLRLGLTKNDTILISIEWAECVMQRGDIVLAKFDTIMAAHQVSQQRANAYLNANPITVQFNL